MKTKIIYKFFYPFILPLESLLSFFQKFQKGTRSARVKIVNSDPAWPKIYETEKKEIENALGKSLVEIHHFGSTSVPNLAAKPKIDILAVVQSFTSNDILALKDIGYEFKGEVIPTGRYFRKKTNIKFNFHMFKVGNPLIERNLIFRDRLRECEKLRNEYEELKIKLASKHKKSAKSCFSNKTVISQYCKEKTKFINSVIDRAIKENIC